MGSNNSTPPKSPRQENEQRNTRNFTETEVARALENQRKLYESRMKDLIRNQADISSQSTPPAQSPAGSAREKLAPPRPPPPNTKTQTKVSKTLCSESQRTLYSYIPDKSSEKVEPPGTSRPLYPSLQDRNTNVSNKRDGSICVTLDAIHRGRVESPTRFAPSAPPAALLQPALSAEPLRSTIPPEPLRSTIPPEPFRSARPAEPFRSARPAEPFRSARPAEPFRSARPAEPFWSGPSADKTRSVPSAGRSSSRTRSSEDQDITCRTCKNRFGMKIFNCSMGHASCDDCKAQFRACGLCGLRITERRNITLEKYVQERTAPCVNADEGCCLHFSLGEMERHLKECPFKEIQCPLPPNKCRWKGKLSVMAQHFDNFHPTNREANVDTEMFLGNIVTENQTLYLIKLGNFNFIFHLVVSEERREICFAVQLLGTKTSAARWHYEVHVYNKREPRRKYQYVDKCFATSDTIDDIIKDSACAILPLQYAMTFINESALAYKFYIKKDNTQRDSSSTRRGRGGRGRGGYRKS